MDKTPTKFTGKSPRKTPTKSSPYNACMARNNSYCGYISISGLEPHKAYAVYKLEHTQHSVYGEGELAFVRNSKGRQHRVQLPGKYLKEMSEDQILSLRNDVDRGNLPYLVYRETMQDRSFMIDILPDVAEMQKYHADWTDVPSCSDLPFMTVDSDSEEVNEGEGTSGTSGTEGVHESDGASSHDV